MLTPFNNAQGGKIAINGFDDEARRLFGITLNEGVHIDAFVSEEREFHGLRFYNKPIVAMNELGDDWTLLTPWRHRDCAPTGRRACYLPTERELTQGLPLVVCAEQVSVGEVSTALKDKGLHATALVVPAIQPQLVGGGIVDCDAIMRRLAMRYPNAQLLLAGRHRVELELSARRYGFRRVWHFIFSTTSNCNDIVALSKANKIVLWGDNIFELEMLGQRLALLDVAVAYGVVECRDGDTRLDCCRSTLPIKDKTALLQEDCAHTKVLAVSNRKAAREFMRQQQLPYTMFVFFSSVYATIDREWKLDPAAGFAILNDTDAATGLQVRRGDAKGVPIKIAVVGDSMAHLKFWTEPSFLEFMVDIAQRHHKAIEIWNAATAQYIPAQSLARLLRDLIPLRPDIVLYYAVPHGNREFMAAESRFLHTKHRDLLANVGAALGRDVYYGVQRGNATELMEHCLDVQRMMHGVCQEYGIIFHAFIRPTRRSYLTRDDLSWLVNSRGTIWGGDNSLPTLPDFPDKADLAVLLEASQRYEWLHDISDVLANVPDAFFDDTHTNAKGSRIIAGRVCDIIFKD